MGDMARPLLEKKEPGLKRRVSKYLVDPADCDLNGLTTAKAAELVERYGYNELAEKERNKLLEFLKHFWGPMPIMIWLAVMVEGIQGDVADMLVLLALQIINGTVGWFEESKAGDAIAALKNSLAPMCNVKRDGKWQTLPGRELVPGDIVKLALGGNVPADCMVLDGKPVQIDQSAMTGESLPVTMRKGDTAKMGSNVVAGENAALVVATGGETFFGKTAAMINSVDEEGHFQKIIWSITLFLLGISFVLVSFIMATMLLNGNTFLETLSICVVLLVASIPIAMQVVCTSTMALGSHALAKKDAIVSRLAAIEEIAGMDMLCSDKTGTLTLNKMTLHDRKPFGSTTPKELLLYAMLGTQWEEKANDAIDTMLFSQRAEVDADLENYVCIDYMPFDPSIKRTEGTVHPKGHPAKTMKVTKGAPNIIAGLCCDYAEVGPQVDQVVDEFAVRGIRCLGIAVTRPGSTEWAFAGILTFVDPPRPDTKDVIRRALELGVGVKMITGDHVAIAKETCRMLDLGDTVLTNKDIENAGNRLGDLAEGCDGFAGVFPEHKFDIVNALRSNGWIVGMTGDGVNDAPALKRADIGIAVEGATDAARAAADIVLISPGLSVIIDAIDLARQIFQRMKNYIIYRIACTLQLLVFFFLGTLFVQPREILLPAGTPDDERTDIKPFFALPVMAMVLITILNDGTIISIAYDHVIPGAHPEKWDLPIVCAVAALLGAVACASSILMLELCLHSTLPDGEPNDANPFTHYFGAKDLSYNQVMCVIYLKISLSDFLTVFSARTQGPFWQRKPGALLFAAACFAMTVSTLLAKFWPFEKLEPITWKWCAITWGYCIVWWLLQDFCKVLLYKGLHDNNLNKDSSQVKKAKVGKIRQSIKMTLGKEGVGDIADYTGTPADAAKVMKKIEMLEQELKVLKAVVAKIQK